MGAIAVGAGFITVLLLVMVSRKAKHMIWKHAWKICLVGVIGGVIFRLVAP